MTVLRAVLATLAVLSNGLAAGIMLSTVIGIVPMFLSLPYGRYVQTVQFLWPRYDPIMPITNTTTFVLDLVLCLVLAPAGPARATYAVAAGLLAVVITISVSKNVPVNRYVSSLDPDRQPGDWAQRDPRRRWRNWNLVRTSLAVLAFAVNVTAAMQLT